MPTSFAGTGWPRFPYEALRHARQGDFQLVLCPFIVDEARSHIAELLPNALTNFEEFLRIAKYEEVPTPSKQQVRIHVDLVRDPADVPVALAAINAAVDCLVSEDKDLTAQDETTAKLRQELKVYLSGTFLREMMGWTSEELEVIRKRSWSDLAPPFSQG